MVGLVTRSQSQSQVKLYFKLRKIKEKKPVVKSPNFDNYEWVLGFFVLNGNSRKLVKKYELCGSSTFWVAFKNILL